MFIHIDLLFSTSLQNIDVPEEEDIVDIVQPPIMSQPSTLAHPPSTAQAPDIVAPPKVFEPRKISGLMIETEKTEQN
jgi:hypothetical protein